MKSAREMFEELGYTTRKEEFRNDEIFRITFANYKKGDWVEITKERIEIVKDRTKGYLDIPTLQATNKQVEELHWNDTIVNIDAKLDGKKVMEAMRGGNLDVN